MMRPRPHSFALPAARRPRQARGSVLIIVMWTCLGLVALTLYFANSMSSALRAPVDVHVMPGVSADAALAQSKASRA